MYSMKLKYIVILESKKATRKDRSWVKDSETHMNEIPLAKNGTIRTLTKILTSMG